MERRIFVVNQFDDSPDLERLTTWVSEHRPNAVLTTEPIMSGSFETPFLRVTLEYPSSVTPPQFVGYIPFSVTLTLEANETYTPQWKELDCAILSSYTGLPVDEVKRTMTSAGLEVSFFLEGGVELWIKPTETVTYANLLRGTKNRVLISDDPMFEVALAIATYEQYMITETSGQQVLVSSKILKHPSVDVWYGDEYVNLSMYMDPLANVVRLTPDPEDYLLLEEAIQAYQYREYQYITQVPVAKERLVCSCTDSGCQCSRDIVTTTVPRKVDLGLNPFYSYVYETYPYDGPWLLTAFDMIVDGNIPFVIATLPTASIPDAKGTVPAIRHDAIQAYLKTLEDRGSAYLSPRILELVNVDVSEQLPLPGEEEHLPLPGETTVSPSRISATFIADSKATADAVVAALKPYDQFQAQAVLDTDDALLLRYRLSQAGLASLYLDGYVTWEGPPLSTIPAGPDMTALRDALLEYLTSISHSPEDIVSRTEFSTLSPSELVEIIVTQSRHAYEAKTLLSLQVYENPVNREALTPREILQVSYGATGFFTVGPLKGLRDTVMVPLPVTPPEGTVVFDVREYYTPAEEVNAATEDREPIPSDLRQVDYSVELKDGTLLSLFGILARVDQLSEIYRLVVSAWEAGDFLSLWCRGYIRSQEYALSHERTPVATPIVMSHSRLSVPPQLMNADESVGNSERAIRFLRMLNAFQMKASA